MQQRNYQLNKANRTVCGNGHIFASPTTKNILFSWNYLRHTMRRKN